MKKDKTKHKTNKIRKITYLLEGILIIIFAILTILGIIINIKITYYSAIILILIGLLQILNVCLSSKIERIIKNEAKN